MFLTTMPYGRPRELKGVRSVVAWPGGVAVPSVAAGAHPPVARPAWSGM